MSGKHWFCSLCGCPIQGINPDSPYNQQAPEPGATWLAAGAASHYAIVHDDYLGTPMLVDSPVTR